MPLSFLTNRVCMPTVQEWRKLKVWLATSAPRGATPEWQQQWAVFILFQDNETSVCKTVHQPRETCHDGFFQSDPTEVLPGHCIFLTRSFTNYNFTNHSNNLQESHILHALYATGTNSRPELPPSLSIQVSRHLHGCRRAGAVTYPRLEKVRR